MTTWGLILTDKPIWLDKEGSEKAFGFISGMVNLTCEVNAEPPATFDWYKGNQSVVLHRNFTVYNEDNHSTLQVQIKNASDYGNYKCKATNKMGHMEHKIMLIKGSKPGLPQFSVREATPDSVKVDIDGPENEELIILGYRIQYIRKQEQKKGWKAAHEAEFEKGESPYILSGLSQDTKYYIRVAARNSAGFSDYTNETSFITDKIHADPVTGSSCTTTYLSSKTSQIITIITLHNIIFSTVELKHNL